MPSHREAPEISKDPVADNCDFYAFVSPDSPDTVTFLATYIPAESPNGAPNFYELADDVMYNIYVDNDGDGTAEVTYQFRFHTHIRNPNSFLYNTGPIMSNSDPNWNRYQWYSVHKIDAKGNDTRIGQKLMCPPCNIGPRSTPNYEANLGSKAVHTLASGEKVFVGQRRDPFYVDLGSIFDLLALRPFQSLERFSPTPNQPGVDSRLGFNIHTIALQVPMSHLTSDGKRPTDATKSSSVIGSWAGADRRKVRILGDGGERQHAGPFKQVSRQGQPLVNEVIIHMGQKDGWNTRQPVNDKDFLPNYEHPEVQTLLPVVYPKVFPNLAKYTKPRADLVAILLTGIPPGIVKGFQNYTGPVQADQLRLNMAIPPTKKNPNIYGLLGGDAAGYPNGRRHFDDTTTIQLRAIAGLTIPLVDKSYKPDGAASLIYDVNYPGDKLYINKFPYCGVPLSAYDVPSQEETKE